MSHELRTGWRRSGRSITTLCLSVGLLLAACSDDDPMTAADVGRDTVRSDAEDDRGQPGDAGDDQVTDDADRADASGAEVGDGVDQRPMTVMARFDLDDPVGPDEDFGRGRFFRAPWPFDARRQASGLVLLDDFPGPSRPLINTYVALLEREVRGFASMSVVNIAFDGPIPNDTLPTPAESLESDATVRLVAVSPDRCGEHVPVIVRFDSEGNSFRPANVLMATPVPGFALAPNETYALLVSTDVAGAAQNLIAAPGVSAALAGEHTDSAVNDAFEPLRTCWDDLGDDLVADAENVAAATVFTIQDARAELVAVRAAVVDSEQTTAPVIRDWVVDESASEPGQYETWSGAYDTPIYQRGDSPYTSTGGGFVFEGRSESDPVGTPVLQRWEAVPFVVTTPAPGSPGHGPPYPILIWMDGTGAALRSHLRSSPIEEALAAGLAVASFTPQFTDERAVPGSDPTIHGFNWANGESGRTAFRQQAVDTTYFIRVLREALPALTDDAGLPELDASSLVYGGQSQGSLIGAMLAGVEPEIDAFALNGTGAYISATVVERKDPADFAVLLQTLLGVNDTIDVFHPVVQIVQLGAAPVDVHNYAFSWSGWTDHRSGSHVFLTNGASDHTTPQRLINNLTIVGDLAPVAPAGWDVDPYGVWDRQPESRPISGNRQALDGSELTLASFLDADQGHFTIYSNAEARGWFVEFLLTATEGVPVIP